MGGSRGGWRRSRRGGSLEYFAEKMLMVVSAMLKMRSIGYLLDEDFDASIFMITQNSVKFGLSSALGRGQTEAQASATLRQELSVLRNTRGVVPAGIAYKINRPLGPAKSTSRTTKLRS